MSNTNEDIVVSLPPYWLDHSRLSLRQSMPWGPERLRVREVWPRFNGRGCVYFVIDTEATTEHPEVKPFLVPEYCKSFTGETSLGLGRHGQHVGHTATQYAPGIVLGFVKALDDSGEGMSSWVTNAILWVADLELKLQHAGFRKIINLSLGSSRASAAIESALNYAILKGCFVVCAAGNGGDEVDFPAAHERQAIAVGALDQNDKPAPFSDFGPELDIVAPGVGIEAAWGKTGRQTLMGTSMAAPGAGGVCAIVLEAHPAIRTQSELETFLEAHAQPIGNPERTGAGVPVAPNYMPVQPPVEPPTDIPGGKPRKALPWWAWLLIGVGVALIGLVVALELGAKDWKLF